MTLGPDVPGSIRESVKSGNWSEGRTRWSGSDFDNIQIDQCIDYDWFPGPTELLADKAINGGRGSWMAEFDGRMHMVLYKHKGPPMSKRERRLIVDFMLRPEVEAKRIFYSVLRRENPDHFMVVLCWKEGELAEMKPRGFSKLTFEVRILQVVMEANMKSILSYVPYTSMNMSGDRLTKYLLKASSNDSLKINIDFSKWCLNMSASLVHPTGEVIDRIFGFKESCYGVAHNLGRDSWFLFQDRCLPPESDLLGNPIEGPRFVKGLESLGEGMFQKLWTTVTAMLILSYIEDEDIYPELMGSGDNQVIMAKVPDDMTRQEVQDKILRALHTMSTEAMLPLKLLETFASTIYFEYGKIPYLGGQKVSLDLKMCSRIGSESEETVPSLDARLNSFYSAGVGAASQVVSPSAPFSVASFEACEEISRHKPGLSHTVLVAALSLGRYLGGYKISLYPSFCIV